MAFFNGNTTMDVYTDFIASQLIGTGVWADADPGFFPAGATPAIRVITDGTIYVRLERVVANGNSGNVINGTGTCRYNEIRATFSSGYNAGTHLQTGTTQICGVPLEAWQKADAAQLFFLNNDVGNGNKGLQHFTWVDPTGSIHGAIVASASANTFDYVVFFSIERNATKQYADGFSNVYWTCFPAFDRTHQTSSSATSGAYFAAIPDTAFSALRDINGNLIGAIGNDGNLNRPIYFHAFNGAPTYDQPVFVGHTGSAFNDALYHPYVPWGVSQNVVPAGRYAGFEQFFGAYRSPGDSKVYFQFPWYNNNADPRRRSLIAQTQDQWFMVGDSSYGITDGDIVDYTAPGPVLKRYLVKQIPNPEAGAPGGALNIAIRFA